jgi:hypothetical protein
MVFLDLGRVETARYWSGIPNPKRDTANENAAMEDDKCRVSPGYMIRAKFPLICQCPRMTAPLVI